jgi:hypothetical protein
MEELLNLPPDERVKEFLRLSAEKVKDPENMVSCDISKHHQHLRQ